MEKANWTIRIRNEGVLKRVEESNIQQAVKRRNANWIGHILRRNCLLKRVFKGEIEGRLEVTGIRGMWRKKLLDDHTENRGYWKLKVGRTRSQSVENSLWKTQWSFVRRRMNWNNGTYCFSLLMPSFLLWLMEASLYFWEIRNSIII